MPEGPLLDYHIQSNAGIRWRRIRTACVLLTLIPLVQLSAQAAVYPAAQFFGNSSTAFFLLISLLPALTSNVALLAGSWLLATSHRPPPEGEGLSNPRRIAAVFCAGYVFVNFILIALNGWRVRGMASSSPWKPTLESILSTLDIGSSFGSLALPVFLCLLMARIARRSGQRSYFWITLIAALTALTLDIWSLWVRYSNGDPLSCLYWLMTLSRWSSLLGLAFWPTLAVLAWTSARREMLPRDAVVASPGGSVRRFA